MSMMLEYRFILTHQLIEIIKDNIKFAQAIWRAQFMTTVHNGIFCFGFRNCECNECTI